MKPIRRILVATDFSPPADGAVRQALAVARHVGAELVIVHAHPVTSAQLSLAQAVVPHGDLFRQVLRQAVSDVHDQLQAACERVRDQGVAVSTLLVDAPAHEGICRAAHELDVDLVVVGSHGRTGLKRLLLGSVAEKILRACKRSVLISRGDAGASGFRRIVVPTDFSPLAELAAEVARTVAARGAMVQLVHCWQLPVMLLDYQGTLAPIARDLQHEARTRGRQSVARLRSAEIDVSFTDLEGPPAYVIPELVEQRNAELVVIGSHGLRGWRRLLLGSVAETTARHATCSVLVARDPSIKE